MMDWWFQSPFLTWGLGPVLAANIGFWPLCMYLEWYLRQYKDSKKHMIVWKGNHNNSRLDDLHNMHKKHSPYQQLFDFNGTIIAMIGPSAWVGSLASTMLLSKVIGMDFISIEDLSTQYIIKQLLLMEVVCDFTAYWGHRWMHTIPFLYENFHVHHHKITTPTALSTGFIDVIDATADASVPIVIATLVARPVHPIIFYIFTALLFAQRMYNHSGIEGIWLDWIFVRCSWLGRSSSSLHDSHHKFGGRAGLHQSKNFGLNFWIWDWVFGTYSDKSSLRVN